MAYNPAELRPLVGRRGVFRVWTYKTTDTAATVNTAGYIADAETRGMQVNDLVIVIQTDTSAITFFTVNAIASGAADLTDGLAVAGVVAIHLCGLPGEMWPGRPSHDSTLLRVGVA